MRIVAEKNLYEFIMQYADSRRPIQTWKLAIRKAVYKNANDVLNDFPSASFIGSDRVVFRIKWNKYRIIASISYSYQALYIKFIWTHAEYDKVDAAKINVY